MGFIDLDQPPRARRRAAWAPLLVVCAAAVATLAGAEQTSAPGRVVVVTAAPAAAAAAGVREREGHQFTPALGAAVVVDPVHISVLARAAGWPADAAASCVITLDGLVVAHDSTVGAETVASCVWPPG